MISSDTSAVADSMPAISPMTGEVVFVQRDSSGKSIWKMKADGSGRTPLSSGPNDNYPAVSPSGDWVTYTSFDPKRMVRRVPLRGGPTQTIYDKPGARQSAVSPDGTRVAVALGQEIVIVPAGGGPPLQSLKTHSIDWRSSLQWIDNGRAIAYVHNEGGVFNVWKQPIAGGKPTQVTDFKEGLIVSFSISPDGRSLAYAQGSVLADVVLITDFQELRGEQSSTID
jgi:Tol biopolymer transport system component